jgi:hypothetical protein
MVGYSYLKDYFRLAQPKNHNCDLWQTRTRALGDGGAS